MTTTQVHTPRPTPQFFPQPQTFSTKKQSRSCTPKDSLPPRPPSKSVPLFSRIFRVPSVSQKALPVSFKVSPENSTLSPHYNDAIKDLYFNQCFDIEAKIGAGSFGEVFKVRSKEDGCLYAVKRSKEHFRGEVDRLRKLEEVAKHEKLPDHPNCVRFIKAWEEKCRLYIQTELCKCSLSNISEQNHNIPEKLIWNYLVDLLMAVKHLHDHDLVHMDIKPENIFISDDSTCKLGDFGLVLDLTKGVDSEAQEGDPKYLSPELMQGKFGKPADIFSLGISILELACDLDLPRGGDLWHQLRSGHLPEEFLLGVSDGMKTVIKWMMEPDCSRRPTVDDVLNHAQVSQIWKVRKRQQAVRNMGIPPVGLATPPPPCKERRRNTPHNHQHHSESDHSFSDDDVFEEGISITNNSLGAPLDSSVSSNTSMSSDDLSKDNQGFVIPRKNLTTPGCRQRPRRLLSDSPAIPEPISIFSSSPVSQPCHSPSPVTPFFGGNDSLTPNSSFHEALLDLPQGHADVKTSIEPKNLMDAFLCASDNDSD